MKKVFLLLVCVVVAMTATAQLKLSLEQCRDMALSDNTKMKIDAENEKASELMRKSVLARFFPQFSANGLYSFQSERTRILPRTMNTGFGTLGLDGLSINAPWAQVVQTLLPDVAGSIDNVVSGIYSEIYNQFDLNTQHVFAGQVGVVQPIYLGGKIYQSYRIAKSMEKIGKMKGTITRNALVVSVDEAYWRVVSVAEKKKLATQFVELLEKLESDVTFAIEEGVATKADLLQVRVKKNEAEASLAQATDGLELSKMALCQIIGLPLITDIELDDSGLDSVLLSNESINIEEVLNSRQEIQMLQEAEKAAKAGVGLVSSTLQPNIVATANYVVTNPNLQDGFQRTWGGMWQAGVVVNIPIAHASDILMVKAAKHKANTVSLQLQEAKEKIELQATQSAQKVFEANKKLIRSEAALKNAEENLRYAQESYDEGVVTSSTLMMAQTAWQKAYSEKIDAAIELRMAEITLKKNTGTL